MTGIRNSQISLWIEEAAADIKRELSKAQKSVNGPKDISILELDELCTYIKKGQRTGENIPSYGLLWTENQIKLLILK